jgi:hypothetical protein
LHQVAGHRDGRHPAAGTAMPTRLGHRSQICGVGIFCMRRAGEMPQCVLPYFGCRPVRFCSSWERLHRSFWSFAFAAACSLARSGPAAGRSAIELRHRLYDERRRQDVRERDHCVLGIQRRAGSGWLVPVPGRYEAWTHRPMPVPRRRPRQRPPMPAAGATLPARTRDVHIPMLPARIHGARRRLLDCLPARPGARTRRQMRPDPDTADRRLPARRGARSQGRLHAGAGGNADRSRPDCAGRNAGPGGTVRAHHATGVLAPLGEKG